MGRRLYRTEVVSETQSKNRHKSTALYTTLNKETFQERFRSFKSRHVLLSYQYNYFAALDSTRFSKQTKCKL
ncbi:hypothetical protein Btru_050301 [Bulinus truncatus]|nr:hypothetical protein Btru_050301 [Bulinus truncatus]